jgi:hypothetical protein
MMLSHSVRGVIAAAAVFAASSAFAGQNLIVNGDFSTPSVAPGWSEWSPGTAQTGWTSVNDAIEIGYSPIYGLPCANAACQQLEVNANTFGDNYQNVSGLKVGDKYTLSYLYGGRTSGGPDLLDVYFGGNLLTIDSGSIGVWTLNAFSITATATTEKLEFISQVTAGLPSYGNEITNVSLSAPEPSSWVMMILGFAGLGYAGYRKAKGSQVFLAA